MAKIIKPLTAKQVESVKPREKDFFLFDGDNLRIKISPSNKKVWYYYFEWDGKTKKITIGDFRKSSTIAEVGYTLEEARREKEKFKLMLQNGECPQNEKKVFREKQKTKLKEVEVEYNKMLKNIIDDYFAFVTHLSPSHKKNQESRIKNKITIFLGHRSIDSITSQEFLECLTRIESIEIRHRVLTLCGQIWRWAKSNYRTTHDITVEIDRINTLPPVPKSTNFRTITDPKKIGLLLNAIDDYIGDISTKTALQLAPYVALRPYNIRFAEWNEINFENKMWTISGSKMKMGRDHIIPLTDTMINIINTMRPYSFDKSIYIFPSPISNFKPLSENTLNYALKRLGYQDEIVSHGFRAMFSTVANEFIDDDNAHGVSRDIIEFQLAHQIDNKVGSAYNRALYLKQRTRLVEWWSDYLDGLRNSDKNN